MQDAPVSLQAMAGGYWVSSSLKIDLNSKMSTELQWVLAPIATLRVSDSLFHSNFFLRISPHLRLSESFDLCFNMTDRVLLKSGDHGSRKETLVGPPNGRFLLSLYLFGLPEIFLSVIFVFFLVNQPTNLFSIHSVHVWVAR